MPETVKAAKRKRPYRKPAFEREDLFETMALACGKWNAGGGRGSGKDCSNGLRHS